MMLKRYCRYYSIIFFLAVSYTGFSDIKNPIKLEITETFGSEIASNQKYELVFANKIADGLQSFFKGQTYCKSDWKVYSIADVKLKEVLPFEKEQGPFLLIRDSLRKKVNLELYAENFDLKLPRIVTFRAMGGVLFILDFDVDAGMIDVSELSFLKNEPVVIFKLKEDGGFGFLELYESDYSPAKYLTVHSSLKKVLELRKISNKR